MIRSRTGASSRISGIQGLRGSVRAKVEVPGHEPGRRGESGVGGRRRGSRGAGGPRAGSARRFAARRGRWPRGGVVGPVREGGLGLECGPGAAGRRWAAPLPPGRLGDGAPEPPAMAAPAGSRGGRSRRPLPSTPRPRSLGPVGEGGGVAAEVDGLGGRPPGTGGGSHSASRWTHACWIPWKVCSTAFALVPLWTDWGSRLPLEAPHRVAAPWTTAPVSSSKVWAPGKRGRRRPRAPGASSAPTPEPGGDRGQKARCRQCPPSPPGSHTPPRRRGSRPGGRR